jgi:hypothetical protein
MMNEKTIDDICKEVYRRFPEIRGVKPKIQPYRPSIAQSASASTKSLLIFQGGGVTDSKKTLTYIVRVVVDADGKISRMSMSH